MRTIGYGLVLWIAATAAACGGDDEAQPMGPMGEMEEHGHASGATCPTSHTQTWESFGERFMTSYCGSCHGSDVTGEARHGAPADLDFDSVASVRANATEIDEHAAIGPAAENRIMPPADTGAAPTDAERRDLGEWLACGAPAVAPIPGPGF